MKRAFGWTVFWGTTIVSIFLFALWIVSPLFQQARAWLETGAAPPRDLYWALAPVRCEATDGVARGFDGMDACRKDFLQFTDWVGLNQIFNWVADLHVGILAAVGILLLWIVAAPFMTDEL